MSSPFEHRRHHRAAAHVEGEKIEEACNIRPGMCTNNYSSMSSLWEHTNAQLTKCRFLQKTRESGQFDTRGLCSNVPTNPITITRIFPHWPMEQIQVDRTIGIKIGP